MKRYNQAHIKRARRQAETIYWWRREHVGEDFGFLAPIHPAKRDALHNMAIKAPFHWQVMAIVYCRTDDGSEYREFEELRSHQMFASRGDGIVPLLEQALSGTESRVNPKHVYGRATLMRPWSPRLPSMAPVLRRLRDTLDLSEAELAELEAEDAA